ncbi:MAG: hypothetical protein KAV82_04580 [Phycisphaerae bacterium]|nr:hypothetical protein [Phycisphaerae bacterium]
MGPIIALFWFTLRQTLLTRKIWMALALLAGPSVLTLVVRNVDSPLVNVESLWKFYHALVQFLLIMVIVPLVCMVHGTGLIGAEVEGHTLVHLITRRMRRSTVLLVKFISTAFALAVLCDLAIVALHLSTFLGQDMPTLLAGSPGYADWSPGHDLVCYLAMIPVGVVGFLAVFTAIGMFTAQPLALSAFYLIVVEIVIGNIPIGARVYSLLHPLRVTMVGAMPRLTHLFYQSEMSAELRQQLYPEGATGLPTLFVIVLIALALSSLLVTRRELMPRKVSRE